MSTATKNMLSFKLMYQLVQYVEKHYEEKGLGDREFAEIAQTSLGFPVTEGNVSSARKAIGLEASRTVRISSIPEDRIKALEVRVLLLETRISTYFGDKP